MSPDDWNPWRVICLVEEILHPSYKYKSPGNFFLIFGYDGNREKQNHWCSVRSLNKGDTASEVCHEVASGENEVRKKHLHKDSMRVTMTLEEMCAQNGSNGQNVVLNGRGRINERREYEKRPKVTTDDANERTKSEDAIIPCEPDIADRQEDDKASR
jgi:hypothetical protein